MQLCGWSLRCGQCCVFVELLKLLLGTWMSGFSSLQGAGSAGDVCQAPCFSMCYKALLGRVGILKFSEQFLLSYSDHYSVFALMLILVLLL